MSNIIDSAIVWLQWTTSFKFKVSQTLLFCIRLRRRLLGNKSLSGATLMVYDVLKEEKLRFSQDIES